MPLFRQLVSPTGSDISSHPVLWKDLFPRSFEKIYDVKSKQSTQTQNDVGSDRNEWL